MLKKVVFMNEFIDYFDFSYVQDSNQLESSKKYLILVIYDIVDNKRRRKFSKFLNRYGVRVQRSAFECVLDNKRFNKLVFNIQRFVDEDDLVRVYKLYGDTDVMVWGSV